jgi:phage-related protein
MEVDYYVTASGRAVFQREVRDARLTPKESVRFGALVSRVAAGDSRRGDVDKLRGPIYELRLKGDRRIFRALCSFVHRDGRDQLIVLLLFTGKKQQQADGDWIDLAATRLADYKSRLQ